MDKIISLIIVLIIQLAIGFILVKIFGIDISFFYLILCLMLDIPFVEILEEDKQ